MPAKEVLRRSSVTANSLETKPPNPVLFALEASAHCDFRARHFSRDRRMAERLRAAASAMDRVACGLVEAAKLAADQAAAVRRPACTRQSARHLCVHLATYLPPVDAQYHIDPGVPNPECERAAWPVQHVEHREGQVSPRPRRTLVARRRADVCSQVGTAPLLVPHH
eukprot:6504750-Prymnesium_polylepis.1